jgi:hypothetical protein
VGVELLASAPAGCMDGDVEGSGSWLLPMLGAARLTATRGLCDCCLGFEHLPAAARLQINVLDLPAARCVL